MFTHFAYDGVVSATPGVAQLSLNSKAETFEENIPVQSCTT